MCTMKCHQQLVASLQILRLQSIHEFLPHPLADWSCSQVPTAAPIEVEVLQLFQEAMPMRIEELGAELLEFVVWCYLQAVGDVHSVLLTQFIYVLLLWASFLLLLAFSGCLPLFHSTAMACRHDTCPQLSCFPWRSARLNLEMHANVRTWFRSCSSRATKGCHLWLLGLAAKRGHDMNMSTKTTRLLNLCIESPWPTTWMGQPKHAYGLFSKAKCHPALLSFPCSCLEMGHAAP